MFFVAVAMSMCAHNLAQNGEGRFTLFFVMPTVEFSNAMVRLTPPDINPQPILRYLRR